MAVNVSAFGGFPQDSAKENLMSRTGLQITLVLVSLIASACSEREDTTAKDESAKASGLAAPATTPSAVQVEAPAPDLRSEVATPAPVQAEVAASSAATVPSPADKPLSATAPAAPNDEPKQHIVKGVVTQWRPMISFIQPGDSVTFRQMSGHDSQTMDGLIPANAQPWGSKMGAEGFTVTPQEAGAYLYKCNPHASTGMIGVIVVGDLPPHNLAALEASPLNKGMTGRAIRKLKKALAAKQ